jgi:hypothetical protein
VLEENIEELAITKKGMLIGDPKILEQSNAFLQDCTGGSS